MSPIWPASVVIKVLGGERAELYPILQSHIKPAVYAY